jgi:hypothetical protein
VALQSAAEGAEGGDALVLAGLSRGGRLFYEQTTTKLKHSETQAPAQQQGEQALHAALGGRPHRDTGLAAGCNSICSSQPNHPRSTSKQKETLSQRSPQSSTEHVMLGTTTELTD